MGWEDFVSLLREPEANQIVHDQLDRLAKRLEEYLKADVLAYNGPIYYGADDVIREAIESRSKKRAALAVILQTTGGYIEVAQRIADTFHHHYRRSVQFFVPNYAMSAGTVLVMSGDAIYMDYYSVLGPVDPQVERTRPDGRRMVPALGYLEKYKELVQKSLDGTLSTAELTFLVQRFDPAELHEFEQARELSKTLLREWLARFKFKDWKRTKTRKLRVTKKMKEQRAEEVADKLNDTKKWHVHGRGISMAVLKRELNLKIDNFGADKKLNDMLREYHRVFVDYCAVIGLNPEHSATHVPGLYRIA